MEWDNMSENINISAERSLGYWESKHHKPWFDEECSKLVDRRRKAKLQWLQNPTEVTEDYHSNVRREASRLFRQEKREYLKEKINELESNSKTKTIRDLYRYINEFKMGYQLRTL
jgi:hypothetical protein